MRISAERNGFQAINRGYNNVFSTGKLSLGLVIPIESYPLGPVPTLKHHLERALLAESLGFSALWLRDVPFNVPSFGDAGQTFDPFVYLGYLAAHTETIGLGVASIILPLRHPAHVAKAAASVDILSEGRLILGIASGDRPQEYPALGLPFDDRAERFRESYRYLRQLQTTNPSFESSYGNVSGGIDMLPKPVAKKIPLLITGSSRQSMEWVAQHGDGWMIYPRPIEAQKKQLQSWREQSVRAGQRAKPALQPLYIDLEQDPGAYPVPIHLGFRTGTRFLTTYLHALQDAGVNHIAINLRFNRRGIEETLSQLAREVLPEFVV